MARVGLIVAVLASLLALPGAYGRGLSAPIHVGGSGWGGRGSGSKPQQERRLADSNRCKRLCRPLPNHSAKAPERQW
jgi:hypothetical protein